MINSESDEIAKRYIRICIEDVNTSKLAEGLNQERNDGYESTVDFGYEDLDMKEDQMKIQLYMNCDIITLNNNKEYRVIKRVFQPNRPVMLCLDVEEIK